MAGKSRMDGMPPSARATFAARRVARVEYEGVAVVEALALARHLDDVGLLAHLLDLQQLGHVRAHLDVVEARVDAACVSSGGAQTDDILFVFWALCLGGIHSAGGNQGSLVSLQCCYAVQIHKPGSISNRTQVQRFAYVPAFGQAQSEVCQLRTRVCACCASRQPRLPAPKT